MTIFSGTRLRLELDRIPLWRGNHVSVKQLVEDFSQYLYLPRLTSPEILLDSVREGAALPSWQSDTFAYAEGWDEQKQRYQGLKAGQHLTTVVTDGRSVIVKPEVAALQQSAEAAKQGQVGIPYAATPGGDAGSTTNGGLRPGVVTGIAQAPPLPRRFHGSVELDATRIGRDAGKIAEEVVQHLTGLVDSKVEVTLEIQAEIPDGVPENIVRTVTENCRTLKFKTQGFEEE